MIKKAFGDDSMS